jgi:hypothetical protein
MDHFGALRQSRRMPWWTSPAGINFGFLVPIMLLIAWVGDSAYAGLTIRGIRFLTPYYIALGCGVLLVSGLSGWIGSYVTTDRSIGRQDLGENWNRAAKVVGVIVLLAYGIWFRDFVFNPILLINTLVGAYRPDRSNIQLTTGITSLSNAAPVFFSIYAYQVIVRRVKVSRSMHVMCAMLVGFTLFRVYAWSERLAMIEASVPFGLAGAAFLARAPGRLSSVVLRAGPFLAIPILILYFAMFEYIRSWQSATYNKHFGFWEFATGRLVSYYYTSLNNGAGMLATANWPTFKFENTLTWLHRAPFIGPLFSRAVDLQYIQLEEFLTKFGDAEFNNPSGIYGVFVDLGLPLGTVYFCLVGFSGGLIYRAYRSGSLAGVLFYPLFFIAFLEVFRMAYLGMSRAFIWTLGIALALLLNRRKSRRPEVFGAPKENQQPIETT